MTNRYFLILEEHQQGFETLDDLLKSNLLDESDAVYYSKPLTTPTMINNGMVNITDRAAAEWAGDRDLYLDVVVPPMFGDPLADLIQAWRSHHVDGAPYPGDGQSLADEQAGLRDDYQAAVL